MKNVEPVVIILVAALTISVIFNLSLFNSNANLNPDFISLNNSYNSLNVSYIFQDQQYQNSLSNFLSLINESSSNSTINPPISEMNALSIALNNYVNTVGNGNVSSLEEETISIGLYNFTVYHYGWTETNYETPVTEPVSNYSAITVYNATYPGIYTTYYYAWNVVLQSPSCFPQGSMNVCYIDNYPVIYWIDASNGEFLESPPFY
jgi:hypothetical protein